MPWSAAGWPAVGGMAYSKVRLALAKSRWLFCRTLVLFSQKEKLQKLCVGRWGACLPVNVCAEFSSNLQRSGVKVFPPSRQILLLVTSVNSSTSFGASATGTSTSSTSTSTSTSKNMCGAMARASI